MAGRKRSLRGKIEKKVVSSRRSKRRKSYTVDLRVHTPASSGYFGIEGLDTAPAMISLAKVKGIDVIAVTDFYSGAYVDRLIEASQGSPITIIPGVDIRCSLNVCRDMVLTCLFQEDFGSAQINALLTRLGVPESAYGDRSYIVQREFDEIVNEVEKVGGRVIPSRMDKTPQRLSVLPLLVEKYGFRTFDLAYADSKEYFKKRWPRIKFNLFSFSNANSLAQLGSRTAKLMMHVEGFVGIKDLVAREARLAR
ncbi:MAG: hypothetical protein D6808_02920 [Candidatus Dadabacteria bacterium]|nr:MAG: hypothetical protein D6808_02920 [Candidatus Dadabacteria bacterium]